MRKGVKVLCMLLVLLVGLPGLNVSIASPSDVPVVTPGTDPTALLLGAARYRSFDNVNPPEVFIGVYDLGAGRPYRASGSATWTGQNDLTLVYDPTNNWLTTTISNTIGSFTTTYPNYFEAVRDLKFAGDAATASRMLDSLNYLQIQIKINDPAPTQVYLTGVTLDGSSLGDFHGVNDLILHWQVNEVDLSDGFTLTGTLHLTGPFKNNQEWNRVEIDFGRVDHQGPLSSDVLSTPSPAGVSQPITVTAVVDDSTTGNSLIASAEYSLDNGTSWLPMSAQDGTFDEVNEAVTVTFPAPGQSGTYDLCVRGSDDASNTGSPACIQVTVGDVLGPLTSNVVATPNPVSYSQPITVTAVVDDSTTGNSLIASAEYTLDGGTNWLPMQAQDGAFDEVNEGASATFTAPDQPGTYDLCVRGWDETGNDGASACIQLVVSDDQGPLASDLVATPNPAVHSQPITVTASIDDSTKGNSPIASAEYSLDGGVNWLPMQAQDGAFDEVSEAVTVTFSASAGTHDLCVRGQDTSGNTGAPVCTTLGVNSLLYLPLIFR